jgi:pimeloyl-ACP methyl ester carboxylesterase
MFFPSTNETVLTKKDLASKTNNPNYLNLPTIIMCNPNALFYHHMVNAPNAFWLNFFLKKGVNVMAWNYRGYGHTKGSPTPYNIKVDGEAVLYFMLNELKLEGNVGVYGRSLGGVVATHIAAKYPS